MWFKTKISLKSVRDGVQRPNFPDLYRQATFQIASEGIPHTEVQIWVHQAWPDAEVQKVACSFLAQRLSDMAAAAAAGDTYSPEQLDRMWQRVKPAEGSS